MSGGIESGDSALAIAEFDIDMSATGLVVNGSANVDCQINFLAAEIGRAHV